VKGSLSGIGADAGNDLIRVIDEAGRTASLLESSSLWSTSPARAT
jgi:hypothetical protein